MIKRIRLTRFKKYKNQEFCIHSEGISLLVGGNNSGKSTLIHALSVWEFCKMILIHEKGRKILNENELEGAEGLGMSAEDFLPLALPSLNHLWTNLKTQLSPFEKKVWQDQFPGYILRINCIWDYKEQVNKQLEIGLSLVNDRLFIRVTSSNIQEGDYIPTVVYLPTFAGVLPKENKVTIAERRALLGRGMAGSVLRNMIYDLYVKDQEIKSMLLQGKKKFSTSDKERYIKDSPLQRLNKDLRDVFSTELEIDPFSEEFNTVLRIYERKGKKNEKGIFEPFPKSKYTPRDIISQGSGFLQWLSTFCILYGQNVDALLLDEPDAHLHASLQRELLIRLQQYVSANSIQILISTHSVEMIKMADLQNIFSMDSRKYLPEEASRVSVLSGIGSEYFPRLDLLKKYKRVMFIENESDRKILSILAEKCGIPFSTEVVFWTTTDKHDTRRHLFDELKKIIPELKGISIRDRDMDEPDIIGEGLVYKGIALPSDSDLKLLEWRRKNIESYLLCPKAIALASGRTSKEVIQFFSDKHALSISEDGFIEEEPPQVIKFLDGKKIFTSEDIGLEVCFGCNKYDVAKKMSAEEVCNDVKTFLTQVNTLFFSK